MITPMINLIEDAYNEYVHAYIEYNKEYNNYFYTEGYSSDLLLSDVVCEPLKDLYYTYGYLKGVIDTFEQSGFDFHIEYDSEQKIVTIPKIIYIECYHVAYTFEEEANR